jgi:hypothetical protein
MKPSTSWTNDSVLASGVKEQSPLMSLVVDHLRAQGSTCTHFGGHVRNSTTGTVSKLIGMYDDTAAILSITIFNADTKEEDTLTIHYIKGYWSLSRGGDPLTGGSSLPTTELVNGKLATLPALPVQPVATPLIRQ